MIDKENNLEKLKRKLYRKDIYNDRNKEPEFKKSNLPTEEVKTDWGIPKEEPPVNLMDYTSPEEPNISMIKKIAIFTIVAVGVAFGLGFYFVFWGGNSALSKNIEIIKNGPASIAGGEPLSVKIEIKNTGNIAIETADLVLEYPEGSKPIADPSRELLRERRSVGKIGAGETVGQVAEAILFGEENSIKKIKISLEYRLKDSNAIIVKEDFYEIRISQSPVGVTMNFPVELKTKQEFQFEVEVKSNSNTVLKGLSMKMDYPPGFQFLKSKPDPKDKTKNNLWFVGDIDAGKSKKILITGIIEGQDLEEKAFYSTVGVFDGEKVKSIYGAMGQVVVLKSPSFNVTMLVNGKDLEKNVINPGGDVECEIVWENNLPVRIYDATLKVKLAGVTIDPTSISASDGYYRSADNSIVWTKASFPDMETIDPGTNKSARFNLTILKDPEISKATDKNFIVKLSASIIGKRISEDGSGNIEVSANTEKTVKISTDFQFVGRAYYYSGPFQNTGPIPPQIGKETTYTIVWSLVNSSNDVSGVKITSGLPSYVNWLGDTLPADSNILFKPETGEIVWDVGQVKAGTGRITPAKEVMFRVGLTPASNQLNATPEILLSTNAVWYDDFTEISSESEGRGLTTNLTNDSQFNPGDGVVRRAK